MQLKAASEEGFLDVVTGYAAWSQYPRLFAAAIDDGGFNPAFAAAAIQDDIDPAGKSIKDMFCSCRADSPGRVRAWCGDGATEDLQQSPRRSFGRYTKRDAVEPGARQPGDGAVGPTLQNQRHRSRPERRSEMFGDSCWKAKVKGGINAGDMADEWIEGGALLCGENTGHSIRVAGIGAKPVDGLGGKRDKAAFVKGIRRRFKGVL